MHLVDAFIQSDLQCIQAIRILSGFAMCGSVVIESKAARIEESLQIAG